MIGIDDLCLSPEKKTFLVNADDLPVRMFGTKSFFRSEVMFNVDEVTDKVPSIQIELDQKKDKIVVNSVVIDDEG